MGKHQLVQRQRRQCLWGLMIASLCHFRRLWGPEGELIEELAGTVDYGLAGLHMTEML